MHDFIAYAIDLVSRDGFQYAMITISLCVNSFLLGELAERRHQRRLREIRGEAPAA